MKRFVLGILLLFVVDGASGQLLLKAGVGVTAPLAPSGITDLYGTGWGITGAIGFVSNYPSNTDVFFSVQYASIGLDEDALLEAAGVNADISGGDATVLGASMSIRRLFAGSPRPYIIAGAGYTRFTIEDLGVGVGILRVPLEGAETDALTLIGGFGLAFPTQGTIEPFAEVSLNYLLSSGDDVILLPVRAGLVVRNR